MGAELRVDNLKLRHLVTGAKGLGQRHVAVGILQNAEPPEDGEITMAGIAAVHEYGATIDHPDGYTITIPERAPIRRTLAGKKDLLRDAAAKLGAEVMAGRLSEDAALGQWGLLLAAEIQRSIQEGLEPPNAKSTIDKKGSSKPLIDTARLLRSYQHEVRAGTGERE